MMCQRLFALLITLTLATAMPAMAAPKQIHVPLKDGKLELLDLSAAMAQLGLPAVNCPVAAIDVKSLDGSRIVHALNAALGAGCTLKFTPDAAIIHYDTEKLPANTEATKAAVRTFTATVAPEATAAQNRTMGLLLPHKIDPARRTVLLVHGLDSDREKWLCLGDLLRSEGYQVGWFSYPSDQPIADSGRLFAKHYEAFRQMFPDMRVDIVAHSMGSLVTRVYIESDAYAGGIDHLILIGPPNAGSRWAKYRFLLELDEHYSLWRNQPEWRPSWMITDGLGEAGTDLAPNSAFIETLNAQPRRDGVKYTIIAGDRHPAWRIAGRTVGALEKAIPDRAEHLWGFRQTVRGIERFSDRLKNRNSRSDGPVSLRSTKLDGVSDRVVLHADHNELFQPIDGQPPLSWDVIRDRLQR
ncbi:MAG TPA: alpha/beta fold hydrolase [Tepidisphaeraceae bacterium]|jgi:pimeloyl-ACP methyl ester carboxylesterase|nr:alpha/beta fold hydrolase [Tepidisphaeraceae bacterium]